MRRLGVFVVLGVALSFGTVAVMTVAATPAVAAKHKAKPKPKHKTKKPVHKLTSKAPPSAASDVSITSCNIDSTFNDQGDVGGMIVNHTKTKSDYEISVNILEGTLRVGNALDDESDIGPGQTSTWAASGTISGGNGGSITCQLVSVQRTPSETSTAASDVSITSCNIDSTFSDQADVAGMIVNHSNTTSDYEISVNILEGTLRVGNALDDETDIGSGESSTWSASGNINGGNGGAITCQLVSVQRTPSQ
jgi:galactitol-specific phosphotransferase system IIB component